MWNLRLLIGWHSKLNRNAGKPNLVLWELLEVLRSESETTKTVQTLVENNVKVNKQLKKYVASDAALKQAWDNYQRDLNWQRLWRHGANSIL